MQNVILKSFNLSLFRNLIEQNLMADNSVKIRFEEQSIKSVALTSSQSFMKMWNVPTSSFIVDSDDMVLDFNDDGSLGNSVPSFEPFNFYVLKGDVFKRFLGVFNNEPVEFAVEVDEEDSTATQVIITGQTNATTPIRCTFNLSNAELMGQVYNDYSVIERFVTPKEGIKSFLLMKDEIDEIKKLIQTLHKTNSENSSYITISVDIEKSIIRVNDKAFNVKFPLIKSENADNVPNEPMEFRMLKSDFIVSGKHTFEFFYDKNDSEKKIIMKTSYKGGVSIMCGTNNIEVNNGDDFGDSDGLMDDDMNISEIGDEYFGDEL